MTDQPTWIFGYGSLIWKQDFQFLAAEPAWISGWKRKEGANPKSPAMSFSIERKDAEKKSTFDSPPAEEFDDDIPF